MENNSIIGAIPWPVAAAAAIWFGVLAYKAGRNCVIWAVGGGVLGLVLSSIVLGLAQATFIPFSSKEIPTLRLGATGLAILVVVGVGWLFTGGLHRRLLASWRERANQAPETPAKAPAPSLKQ